MCSWIGSLFGAAILVCAIVVSFCAVAGPGPGPALGSHCLRHIRQDLDNIKQDPNISNRTQQKYQTRSQKYQTGPQNIKQDPDISNKTPTYQTKPKHVYTVYMFREIRIFHEIFKKDRPPDAGFSWNMHVSSSRNMYVSPWNMTRYHGKDIYNLRGFILDACGCVRFFCFFFWRGWILFGWNLRVFGVGLVIFWH